MLQAYHGKKVLLVGGLGFIGSTLAHPLVELGAQVRILDNFQPDHGANWHNIGDIRDKVEVHVTDLRDQYALRQLIQDQDVIFNIAAQTSHSDSMVNPFEDLDINCRGNLILLEACRHFNPTARVVFVGTRCRKTARCIRATSIRFTAMPLSVTTSFTTCTMACR
jgi:UDP-glucose 4-epimerase